MDRLSNLPDVVLHHILSFMTTQDVVQTTILSKRWENLWISVPNLLLSEYNDVSPHNRHFVDFVNRILILRGTIKIKSFTIEVPLPFIDIKDLDVWVQYACKNDVEELFLEFPYRGGQMFYELPRFVLVNSSVKILKLSMCTFSSARQISWGSLKSLTLYEVPLGGESIQTVLRGCPNLESLKVSFCEGFNGLNTNSASLKKLAITDFVSTEDDVELRISAPNVTLLNLKGYLRRKWTLVDMTSLVHASVDVDHGFSHVEGSNDYQNMLFDVLGNLDHVENLTLGTWCIKILSMKEKKGLASRPSKRKCLTLTTWMKQEELPGMLHLLKCSPRLEKLVLHMKAPWHTRERLYGSDLGRVAGFCNFGGENCLTSQEDDVNCLMHHLKLVKICQFVDQNSVFPLVEFLLKKANVLERMVIRAHKEEVEVEEEEEEEDSILSESLFRASQKLFAIPRSSPGAVVMLLA